MLYVDDAATDLAKINGVEVVETRSTVLEGSAYNELASNVVNVEAVVTSEVVLKARLLIEPRKVAVCETEIEVSVNPLLEETSAIALMELWAEYVGAEVTINGIIHI